MIANKTDDTRRWPIVALVVALFLTALVARSFFRFKGLDPGPMRLSPYFGITAGQLMLLGIWSGMGNAKVLWRLSSTWLGLSVVWLVSFYDLLERWLFRPREFEVIATFCALMVPVAVTGVVMGLVGRFHSRLKPLAAIPLESESALQFDLRHLFIATTISAVLLMGARGVRSFYAESRRIDSMEILIFSLVLAVGYPIIALASTSLCFASQQRWLRLLILIVAAMTVSTFPLLIVPFNQMGSTLYVASTLIGTLVVVASLWVFRYCGYRLMRLHAVPTIAETQQ